MWLKWCCILVKDTITVEGEDNDNKKEINYSLKIFRLCTSKINSAFINNAEHLHIFMPMYNLLKYSDNYSMTSRSLWNYYRDEINGDENENNAANNRINNNKVVTNKSFEYKTKLIRSMPNDNSVFRV